MRSTLPYGLLLCFWGCLQVQPAIFVTAGQPLQQTALFPNGLSKATDLTKVLPNQGYTFAASSDSASNCFASGSGAIDECKKAGSTWSVNKATYNDNPNNPVYICACHNSPYSAESMASDYSYVPLFLRRWVKSVGSVPDTSAHAYTVVPAITVFATSADGWADVLVHESAHAQDQGLSTSSGFLSAIGSDSCVPDSYAQSDSVECYAQDMVVFLYKLGKPYAYSPQSTACMSHQLQAIQNSQAPGLQDFISSTVKANTPNSCSSPCQYTVLQNQDLQTVISFCSGQTVTSLLPLNPQMNGTHPAAIPGENICFPAQCCTQSRKMLRL